MMATGFVTVPGLSSLRKIGKGYAAAAADDGDCDDDYDDGDDEDDGGDGDDNGGGGDGDDDGD